MPVAEAISPLATAALALVRDGATRRELAERLEVEGVRPTPDAPGRLLAELAEHGLVRVARGQGDGATYVVTSLGSALLERSTAGDLSAQLAELEHLRSTLLATIAHELRTPLTAIRTSAGLLLEASVEPTPEQREGMLRTIERNAERMQAFINDVLELSRYRSGAIRLQSRRVEAFRLAEAVVEAIRPLAVARSQRLELTGERDAVVFGDYRRLERALLNLVSNAQRFSPDRGLVAIEVCRNGDDVHWRVTDDGPGIPPEEQRQLFERFFVGQNDRAAEGVGLGLPTALAIAQAHGGRVEVRSAPGEGSTFTLVVPASGPALDEPE